MSNQITTLTFFKYNSLSSKLWAFGMMQFAHSPLKKVKGLTFYKLLGSGKEQFDPKPDWSVYGLLQIWENENLADDYFISHELHKRYENNSTTSLTFYMKNIKAHGLWSGKNLFENSDSLDPENNFIAVITRATIKLRLLRKFWAYVPQSQMDLNNNEHVIFTAGVGERPITQMATFSLWNDIQALTKFAYRGKNHKQAIAQTQALGWYNEEMFTRFQPYKIKGNWEGFVIPDALKDK